MIKTGSFPKVSIIIPTFNRLDLLIKAIESALAQTYPNFEVIVVSDNTDKELIRQLNQSLDTYKTNEKFVFIQHEINKGGSGARNTGIKHATGKYVTFLDDDDYYVPERIEIMMQYMLENNNTYDAIISSMQRIDKQGKLINIDENMARGTDFKSFALDGNIYTGMILIKKEFIDKIGGFDNIPRFQDKLLMLKFFKMGGKALLLKDKLHFMLEHFDERITFKDPKKGRLSHKTIYNFIKTEKSIFSKKEWKQIKYSYYYGLASVSAQSNLFDRIICFRNSLIALYYFNKKSRLSMLKLYFRCITSAKFSNGVKKILNID